MRLEREPLEALRADTKEVARVSQAECKHRSQRVQRTESEQSDDVIIGQNRKRRRMDSPTESGVLS